MLGVVDIAVLRRSEVDLLRRFAPARASSYRPTALPPDAEDYLRANNPRLLELKQRYRAFNGGVMTRTRWTDEHVQGIKLTHFRGDNPFIWQLRENNQLQYLLTAYYALLNDRLGVLQSGEDELFGVHVFDVNGQLKVSRDLLDSAAEIAFLDRALGIANWAGETVLDIGAGYGRLAYRMVKALPALGSILCTDAVAESSFLCEFYLRFRGVSPKAMAVPIDEIEQALSRTRVTLAVNVHSFSECPIEAIRWWLALLEKHGVRYLMIVPNASESNRGGIELRSREATPDQHLDYSAVIESAGYHLVTREPKYLDFSAQAHGLSPTYYHLFERR